MPLFGKKSKDEKKQVPAAGGYPTQHQPAYPQAQPVGAYGGPPPAYSAQPPPQYSYQAPPPQAQYGYPQAQYGYPQAQPQTVVVQGGFEAGARFGAGATANVPPPPPGCAPNAAQMAVMQGQNVVVSQQRSGFMEGTGDGGYCIW